MTPSAQLTLNRRLANGNIWLGRADASIGVSNSEKYTYKVLENEDAVGRAMFDELVAYAREKSGDLVIVLLGGRGAQAMYRIVADLAKGTEIDELLSRLHVITQDALAPMRMDNSLSFVSDFERLLGPKFFEKVKSFTPMRTDTGDPEAELLKYIEKLESLGGIDIFFLGLGPEAKAASHLCYIKPGSGARSEDFAGIIPISSTILIHDVPK